MLLLLCCCAAVCADQLRIAFTAGAHSRPIDVVCSVGAVCLRYEHVLLLVMGLRGGWLWVPGVKGFASSAFVTRYIGQVKTVALNYPALRGLVTPALQTHLTQVQLHISAALRDA